MIPRANSNTNREPKIVQQSAPVNIPDWSKIYGKNSKKTSKNASWLDDDDHHDDGVMKGSWDSDEDDDEDYDGNMIPPHEWIANKTARSQISAFSVCEGAGRTLKGLIAGVFIQNGQIPKIKLMINNRLELITFFN
ncbi:hypothetical protein F0562_008788 [Nyssa sinensis]|uniref:Uncharacterized protein n=1 Tax=Nyssa sinensis TaxID=561372 RepID=A0A5J5A7U9_9ASTE|nr:hypothetical protein F0562_008788 [Nyssa sinensis]